MSLLTKLGLTAPKVIAGAKETVGAPEPDPRLDPGTPLPAYLRRPERRLERRLGGD